MKKQQKNDFLIKIFNFILNRLGRDPSRVSAAEYVTLLFTETKWQTFRGILAFIRPEVQSITRQWSYAPILSPSNARFSLLLVLGKYSYTLGQQPSWRVPLYLRLISHASPLRMREKLSDRGLIEQNIFIKNFNVTNGFIFSYHYWNNFNLATTTAIPFSKGYRQSRLHACRKPRTALLDLSCGNLSDSIITPLLKKQNKKHTLASSENLNWIQVCRLCIMPLWRIPPSICSRLLFQIMGEVSVYGSLSVERRIGIEIRWGWGGGVAAGESGKGGGEFLRKYW